MLDSYRTQRTVWWWRHSLSVARQCLIVNRGLHSYPHGHAGHGLSGHFSSSLSAWSRRHFGHGSLQAFAESRLFVHGRSGYLVYSRVSILILSRCGYFVYSGVSILGQVWVFCLQRGLDTWPGLGILCTAGSRYLARSGYFMYSGVSILGQGLLCCVCRGLDDNFVQVWVFCIRRVRAFF